MNGKKFEVIHDGKIYVLPFVGLKRSHEFPRKTPISEQNYLFSSREHDFDNGVSSEALNLLIHSCQYLAPEDILDLSNGVNYRVIEPMREWKELFKRNGAIIVQEKNPVLLCANLNPKEIFSSEECAKYELPEMQHKGSPIVIYDLIERKFVLLGNKEYNSKYCSYRVILNGLFELATLREDKYRFLIETDESNVCYVEDEKLCFKDIKSYVDITYLENMKVVDSAEIDAFFSPNYEDFPKELDWVGYSFLSNEDYYAFETIAKLLPSRGYSLSHAVEKQNSLLSEALVLKTLPAHIKEFLLSEIKSDF